MNLDQFTTMRGYELAASRQGSHFLDSMLQGEQGDTIREGLKLKRIQFDTSPLLWESLENVCQLLDCSKREFLEMAIYEAIERAQANFQKAFKEAGGADMSDAFFPADDE